uniref:Uncharacterized protein n=1 Tax=Arundo donax TaxID=35708 RepID=A0A0A9GME1_ARUDO
MAMQRSVLDRIESIPPAQR